MATGIDFKAFYTAMAVDERERFAKGCGASVSHLNSIAWGVKPAGALMAVRIERESGGRVRCEDLCPDAVAEYDYLRQTGRAQALAAGLSR